MRVKIQNPDLSGEERSYLTSDYNSGTTIECRSNADAATNNFAIIGEPGQERTESRKITGVSSFDEVVAVSAYTYSHQKGQVVYFYIYDQVSFERKPASGSYSEISGSPLSIDWDNEEKVTLITVSGGSQTDTYRWRFKNSATGAYSDYSDELLGTGVPRDQLGYVIQQVRRNPVAQGVSEEILIAYASDFDALVYEQMPKAWWFYKEGALVSTAVDTYKYSISANWDDFLSMKFMLFKYVNGTVSETYPLTYSPLNEFYNLKSDANQTSDDNARYWTILPPDDSSARGYIGLHPTPKTTACSLKPVYQFELTPMNSFGDVLKIPEATGYIAYILMRIWDDIKNDATNADKYSIRVQGALNGLKRRARRQLGQPELFRFRGQKGWTRMYGNNFKTDTSTLREQYW